MTSLIVDGMSYESTAHTVQLRHLNFVIVTSFGSYYDPRYDFILFSVMTLCVTTKKDYDSCRYIIFTFMGILSAQPQAIALSLKQSLHI